MTQNFDLTRGYFGDAQQVQLPDVFPPFLHREVRKNHGVMACEGSMFKSKFANALTAMMIGALGIASAQNKLSVAYGAEAGEMDPLLQKMCRRYCARFAGDHAQRGVAGSARQAGRADRTGHRYGVDVRAELGPEYGRKTLRDAGWDGSTPVLAVCPINPFCWPVKASLGKALAHSLTGAIQKEPLPLDLFSQIRAGSGRGLREISHRDGGGRSSGIARAAGCFRCWSAWRCWTGRRASGSAKSWAARRFSRRTSSTCTRW